MSIRAIQWALSEAPVTNTADAFVLVALANHCRDDGSHAFPSTATLAKEARLSRSTVFTALGRLKDMGLIEPEGEAGVRGVVSYRLLMNPTAAAPVEATYPAAGYVGKRPIQQPDPPIQQPDTRPIQQPDPNRQEENRQRTVSTTPLPPSRGVPPPEEENPTAFPSKAEKNQLVRQHNALPKQHRLMEPEWWRLLGEGYPRAAAVLALLAELPEDVPAKQVRLLMALPYETCMALLSAKVPGEPAEQPAMPASPIEAPNLDSPAEPIAALAEELRDAVERRRLIRKRLEAEHAAIQEPRARFGGRPHRGSLPGGVASLAGMESAICGVAGG